MDAIIKAYLARAAEIIGERTPSETDHDNAVIEALNQGCSIRDALAVAAARYPAEAIKWDLSNINDIASHYDYLREHAVIMGKIRNAKK
jgi:hypothetical protein